VIELIARARDRMMSDDCGVCGEELFARAALAWAVTVAASV
jgi:hypothetical protein